jgi:hypothetical protein
MSRKHPHRAGNQPVTRRYVAGVVRRARDEIISAIIHAQLLEPDPPRASVEHLDRLISSGSRSVVQWEDLPEAVRTQARLTRYAGPKDDA